MLYVKQSQVNYKDGYGTPIHKQKPYQILITIIKHPKKQWNYEPEDKRWIKWPKLALSNHLGDD